MLVSTEEREWDEEEDDIHVWAWSRGHLSKPQGARPRRLQRIAGYRTLRPRQRWARDWKAPQRAFLPCRGLGSHPRASRLRGVGEQLHGSHRPPGFPEQLPGEGAPPPRRLFWMPAWSCLIGR